MRLEEGTKQYLMTIQFSKEEMNRMEDLISAFLEKMEIDYVVPVDILKVATDLEFDVRGTEFEKNLKGLIVVDEYIEKIEGFDSNKIIVYNCFKDINMKKFIVAHELAHYICSLLIEMGN